MSGSPQVNGCLSTGVSLCCVPLWGCPGAWMWGALGHLCLHQWCTHALEYLGVCESGHGVPYVSICTFRCVRLGVYRKGVCMCWVGNVLVTVPSCGPGTGAVGAQLVTPASLEPAS